VGDAADQPTIGRNSEEAPCPLCGSKEWSLYVWAPSHWGPEVLRVTRCTECEMIFTNPRPTRQDVEQQTVTADVAYSKLFVETLDRARRVTLLQLALGSQFTSGCRLLDFGCGRGITVYEAARQGWDSVGIDLNRELIETASRHWGFNRLFCCSLDEFVRRSPEPFDFILCNQVVEHLYDPVDICRTLAGLLSANGILYLDVPNADQLGERVRRGKFLSPTGHLNHFTKKTLATLMAKVGLKVVYLTGAPSLVQVYHRIGLGQLSYPLARYTHRTLPAIGSSVCAIGQKVEFSEDLPRPHSRSIATSPDQRKDDK